MECGSGNDVSIITDIVERVEPYVQSDERTGT